jgi:glycolate oxidase FAD binding subunit
MVIAPASPEELAQNLASAADQGRTIELRGNGTKICMGGPLPPDALTISTTNLSRLLQYEPKDLTISVEAGMSFAELTRILAEHRQMLPLDPIFAAGATVGGVLAANSSGSRRRLFGAARDMVIGMTFATLGGKLVRTGGMVVKNVAGLDMGKLLIGSFGTLAAIATVNFKVFPQPAATRTFKGQFASIPAAIDERDKILRSTLQPAAIDILNLDMDGRCEMYVQASGSAMVLDRYSREMPNFTALEANEERDLWDRLREFTPAMLQANPETTVVRRSCTLSEVGAVLESLPAPALARAGSGVCYGYFHDPEQALGKGVIEFAPAQLRQRGPLWPSPGGDFAIMEKVKELFDPRRLLNPGRLYGRI